VSKYAKIEAVLDASPWTWKPEYKGIPGRRFKFDYACIRKKVAIEVDGGIWRGSYGGHTSGTGKMRDMEKDALAQLAGWRIFRFAPSEHKRLQFVLDALGAA